MYGKKGQSVWRHQYDRDKDELNGQLAGTSFIGQESLTVQAPTREADINNIVKLYGGEAAIPLPQAPDPSYYFDMEGVPDLRTALESTRDAVGKFNALPADIRARFHNRPEVLWEWITRPDNHEEAVRLGLLAKHVPKPPEKEIVAPPAS